MFRCCAKQSGLQIGPHSRCNVQELIDARQQGADARADVDSARAEASGLQTELASLREMLRNAQSDAGSAAELRERLARERTEREGAALDAAESGERAAALEGRIDGLDARLQDTEARLQDALRLAERAKQVRTAGFWWHACGSDGRPERLRQQHGCESH
jgi:predicted  nucleic acid-binding Zn-ribbon protein